MAKKHFVLAYPSKEISYFTLFKANLNKFKHLPFLKRYLIAFGDTPVVDFFIEIEGKRFRYRETIFNNLPNYSFNEIRRILFRDDMKITSRHLSLKEARSSRALNK